ncbi:MAG: efflux RND transporter permease subunit, partial [Calditrichaeota bacterium]|nr:efflux RND transporter permease subunit [Calditrichota bacterium]
MRKLSEFSVNYPISVLMLVLAVLLLGYISFDKLGMDLFPDLNNPRIFVEIRAGERPPEEMEKQFVKTIESLAIRQKQVIQVSSVTRAGSAQITVEYSWDADMDEAFLDLQKSLSSYSQNSDLEELNLSQHDPNSAPVLLIGFSHPQITDMDALRQVAANYVRNELIRQEGIAAVEIIGAEEKIVVVETDRYQLEAQGLTLATVAAQIQASNINASGGSIVEKGKRYLIKSVGEFQTLEEIGNVIVTRRAAQTAGANAQNPETTPVYLRDIAEISFRNERPDNIVRINGERCLALAIYKETKYNTVKAVERLDETLAELGKALPGYRFRVIQNQASFIRSAVNEVEETALIGIILAVMVLYLFLRRFGATLVMSIAIPISIVAT